MGRGTKKATRDEPLKRDTSQVAFVGFMVRNKMVCTFIRGTDNCC